jgi:ATP-dependent Clp protease ATP-binding subunit ClpA
MTYVTSFTARSTAGELPFTPRAIEILRAAVEEALRLGHNYIGTEHLLLGLFRDPDCVAAKVLNDFGLTYDDAKGRISAKLAEYVKAKRVVGPG